MNRWPPRSIAITFIAACALLTGAGAIFPSESQAQFVRVFPQATERGKISFTEVPLEVQVDGNPERLAPGVRVRTPQNTLALTGSLVGQSFLVNYKRDPMGLIRDIWILTPEEAQTLPDGSALPQAPASVYGG